MSFRLDIHMPLISEKISKSTLEHTTSAMDAAQSTRTQLVDEAILIEERRKRREAIKAKHRGQATPMLVQALVLGNDSATPTSKSDRLKAGQNSGRPLYYDRDSILIRSLQSLLL